jgi:putative ABC transport system permease protein
MIGIIASLLLCLSINLIIRLLSGVSVINAQLPVVACVVLVLISMGLTFVAGLFPSKVAANKDPVVALRTE